MHRSTLFLILLAVVGCDVGTTDIPNPFTLGIIGPTTQEGSVSTNGARLCDLELTAVAQGGEEDAFALWLGLEVQWFDYDEQRWIDPITYGEEEIAEFWGSDRLEAGSSISTTSYWEDPEGHTFQLRMTFYYQVSPALQQRTVRHTFDCN